jgi:hypothetical protein
MALSLFGGGFCEGRNRTGDGYTDKPGVELGGGSHNPPPETLGDDRAGACPGEVSVTPDAPSPTRFPLRLETNTKVSHRKDCKGKHIRIVGPWINEEGDLVYADRWGGCNTYGCATCGPKKIRKLRARVFNGNLSQYVVAGREEFSVKFLTLTFPGGDRRKMTSPEDARKEMAVAFHKLTRALKKRIGKFHHLKVFEEHKDGMPHLHVVLVGDAIRPKNVLQLVRDLWCEKYGMGYVDLRKVENLIHAVRYITLYLTKGAKKLSGQFWSSSRGALERVFKVVKGQWATFVSLRSDATETSVPVTSDEAWALVDRMHNLKFPPLRDRVLEGLVAYFDAQKMIQEDGRFI